MIMNSINMETIKAQLILHEGHRMKPYRCTAGKLTIGVGRNLDDKGLSGSEVDYLLENDIYSCVDRLIVEFRWYPSLSPTRQLVLIDMCFNLGLAGLKRFPKFIKACSLGEWATAAAEMEDSDWYHQVGTRAKRLQYFMLHDNTDFKEVKS